MINFINKISLPNLNEQIDDIDLDTSYQGVLFILLGADVKKPTGPDNIPSKLLKEYAKIVATLR